MLVNIALATVTDKLADRAASHRSLFCNHIKSN